MAVWWNSSIILHIITAELMFYMNYTIIRKVVLNHMSQVMILFTMKILWVSFNIVLYSFYVNFYALRWLEKVLEKSAYFSKTKPKIDLDLFICFRTKSQLQHMSKEKKIIDYFFSAYLSVSTLKRKYWLFVEIIWMWKHKAPTVYMWSNNANKEWWWGIDKRYYNDSL
jgi:hypothetical protein